MERTEIIAELGINHNGDLDLVKQLIDIASAAGCDYVKFQKRDIDVCYTKEFLDSPRQIPPKVIRKLPEGGTTQGQQKRALEFDLYDYQNINEYCKAKRMKWFLSYWDHKSVRLMNQGHFKMPFLKVPSALITDFQMLDEMKKIDTPVIVSTGMSTESEIHDAVHHLGAQRIYCIMHCTSTYPSVVDEQNLGCIPVLRQRYPWSKIGFSNHYPGLKAMEDAVTYGAEVIEFHLTFDRTMYGSDQPASIEPRGAFELIQKIRLSERMRGNGIKKIYDSEIPIKEKLRK